MEQQLRDIIHKVTETSANDFSLDADLRDELDLDSHRAVELVFDIEQTFGVSIPGARFEELRTLRKTMALITSLNG